MTTRLIFSIDTEVSVCGRECDTPDIQIRGLLGDDDWGALYICRALAKHGWQATFFLNIFDEHMWPDGTYQRIVDELQDAGADVQLHTHVESLDGGRFDHLSQYDQAGQLEILQRGRTRLEELTGRPVTWHRSGNLAVNEDTIHALKSAGFVGDSSYAHDWDVSHLPIQHASRNAAVRLHDVLEIPVSTFETLQGLGPLRHFDINACSLQELKHVTRQATEADAPWLIMLMHSFSFIERGQTLDATRVRQAHIDRFEKFLEFCSREPNLDVTTFAEVDAASSPDNGRSANMRTGFWLTWQRAWENRHVSTKNRIVAITPALLVGSLLLVLIPLLVGR